MHLADYFSRRVFRSPFVGYTEVVSGWSAFGAFLFGPVFYWRKRAPIEALLSLVATVPLIGFSDQAELLGFLDAVDLSSMIWTAFALAAPVLLPACYRRKGWDETIGQRSMVSVTDPFARSLARLED
jgi:hypothetical protein